MGKALSFVCQKGGVAKTFSCWALACEFAGRGLKILAVDGDPQSTLTSRFIDNSRELPLTLLNLMEAVMNDRVEKGSDGSVSYYEDFIFEDEDSDGKKFRRAERVSFTAKDVIVTTPSGVDLLPSVSEMNGIDISLVSANNREYVLKKILQEVKDDYDYILIDCSPYLGLMTVNVLTASDAVVIPHSGTPEANEGFGYLIDTIERTKRNLNPDLEIDGVMFTLIMTNEKMQRLILEAAAQESFDRGVYVYPVLIPRTAEAARAIAMGIPLEEGCPKNKTTIAYRRVADDFLKNEAEAAEEK